MTLFFSSFIDVTKNIIGDNQLSSLLGDGVIAGVSAVVMFLPNILILFLGISLLEGTGYMSRVAFYSMELFINLDFMVNHLFLLLLVLVVVFQLIWQLGL